MPTERELIAEIEKHAQTLAQAVAAAEFWHGKTLEAIEQERKKRLAEIEAEHKRSMGTAAQAYDESLRQAKAGFAALEPHYGLAELGWDAPQWEAFTPLAETSIPRLTRVGWLTAQGKYGQIEMPALLPIIGSRNVLIKASGAGKETARAAMQSIMLKLLATLPPAKLRFVCIDPVGLGSTVAGFIKGLPPLLHGGQSWFDSTHIEQQLADVETRIAFVKQKYLGNSFASMEDYNAKAGQIEEPYRLLVVSDFPARFSDSAAGRLISIATNGPSTGVYVLAMVDTEPKPPLQFCSGRPRTHGDDPHLRQPRRRLARPGFQRLRAGTGSRSRQGAVRADCEGRRRGGGGIRAQPRESAVRIFGPDCAELGEQ